MTVTCVRECVHEIRVTRARRESQAGAMFVRDVERKGGFNENSKILLSRFVFLIKDPDKYLKFGNCFDRVKRRSDRIEN